MRRSFFDRPAVEVAPELLGCVLEHETADGLVAVELTEAEAYMGAADPASHAYRGRTARNAVMFGPPGHAYVYFTYGMHFCVNLVCMPPGTASAVLLRAGRVVEGEDLARQRRHGNALTGGSHPPGPPWRDLARGPARLCQALGIDRALDGADVCAASSALRIRFPSGGTTSRYDKNLLLSGPRVGVSSGAEVPWRFWVAGEPTVSAYRAHVPRQKKRQSANRLPPRRAQVAPCRRGRHHRGTFLAGPHRQFDRPRRAAEGAGYRSCNFLLRV